MDLIKFFFVQYIMHQEHYVLHKRQVQNQYIFTEKKGAIPNHFCKEIETLKKVS
jgi:hypothetical protein